MGFFALFLLAVTFLVWNKRLHLNKKVSSSIFWGNFDRTGFLNVTLFLEGVCWTLCLPTACTKSSPLSFRSGEFFFLLRIIGVLVGKC